MYFSIRVAEQNSLVRNSCKQRKAAVSCQLGLTSLAWVVQIDAHSSHCLDAWASCILFLADTVETVPTDRSGLCTSRASLPKSSPLGGVTANTFILDQAAAV